MTAARSRPGGQEGLGTQLLQRALDPDSGRLRSARRTNSAITYGVWTAHLCDLVLSGRLAGSADGPVAGIRWAPLPPLVDGAWTRIEPWLPLATWSAAYYQRVVDLNEVRRAAIDDLVAREIWARPPWTRRALRPGPRFAATGTGKVPWSTSHGPDERSRVAEALYAVFVEGVVPADDLGEGDAGSTGVVPSGAERLAGTVIRAGWSMLLRGYSQANTIAPG